MLGKSKLANGAEHTVGLNSAELTCLDGDVTGELCHGECRGNNCALKDVLRARNYLRKLFLAHVHKADLKVVAVFVGGYFFYLCNYNVHDILAEKLVAFDLGACVGHSVAVVLYIYVADVNVVSKPFH